MADNAVADPILFIFDTENGNIFDAGGSHGNLHDTGSNRFLKTLVCIIPGGNHVKVDVSHLGCAAQWTFAAAGADDVYAAAWRDRKSFYRNSGCFDMVRIILAGKQRLV